MAKVLVYYTGGTIGMKRNNRGVFEPDRNFGESMSRALQGIPGIPQWDFSMRDPLLDSSNMNPSDWGEIALYIIRRYREFESFVILHGTDTMAYTTSALAFMFEGLGKPVIFTGSQIPLSEPDNDAVDNLVGALRIAGNYQLPVPEVSLFFSRKLLRGCRITKVDAVAFDAFDSPNCEPLAEASDNGIKFNEQAPMPPETHAELSVQEFTRTQVGLLRLFPGISAQIAFNFFLQPLEAAVLQAYGSGNGPIGDRNREFREVIEEAATTKILVAVTQCLRGNVDLTRYATGLGALGVISGYDMTAEAALTKLFWLLSRRLSPEQVKEEMQVSLRGELTRPKAPTER